jgi:hypothetical protein
MQNSRRMAKMTAITLILLMASIALMAIPVKAQQYTNLQEGGGIPLPSGVTPDETYPVLARLAVRPNPIGVGQPLLVNVWAEPPIHISHYFKDYTITITKPDGTKIVKVIPSYRGDSTAWFEYTVDQVGTWKVKFDFLGAYFPAGNYTTVRVEGQHIDVSTVTSFPKSVYYQPSTSPELEVVVQQEIVVAWPGSPLPTDYWTRPISPENREWWPIAGSYPWPSRNIYNYQGPYVIAPKTPHIVWKRMGDIAGLPGAEMGQATIFNGPGTPTIIYAGRAYETYSKPGTGVGLVTYWRCYDIRTGELFWERPLASGESAPTELCYDQGGYQYVPGESATQRNLAVTLMSIGTRMIKYDPWSGAVVQNVTAMSGTLYGTDVYSVQDLGASKAPNRYRLIKWTTIDSTLPPEQQTNFTARIAFKSDGSLYNISWPFSSIGIVDYTAGVAVNTVGITPPGSQVTYQQRLEGASLATGQVVFNVTTDVTKGVEGFFSGSTRIADHGKFAVRLNDGHWHCWDLNTGKQLWVSELSSYPWGIFGIYGVESAYDLLYYPQYDGVVAYNWTTGKVAWRYTYVPEYPWEVVYNGTYPFYQATVRVADGILYASNSEHSPSQPITRGLKLHAINATTGEGIWNISGAMIPGGVADGYLTASNSYDGYMYVFGKGKSMSTVMAPDVVVSKGSGVVIKGTVLDISPAQPGTPCVSKDSMATQMEYLHLQHPIDGVDHKAVMTGVPVVLNAIGSDGSSINIGTVTTDGYYGTFSKSWTPPAQVDYKIIASFAGDDSYGSSSASTTMSVGPAPAGITFPEQPTPPDYTMSIFGAAVAVIIAVAVVGILLYRKK